MPQPTTRPVADGPRWYRSRIRTRGPFAALVPPAVLGALALVLLNAFDSTWSGVGGLVAGVCAAPGLLAVGAPLSDRSMWPAGIAISVVLWLLIGFVASRRATRNPVAGWSDFWRDFRTLAVGTWIGAVLALIVVRYILGEALI